MDHKNKPHLSFSHTKHPLIISMLFVSLWLVITLLYRCNFGIDLTDEGFYLNWISNPWIYKISHTQFGFIYYALNQLVGESMVRLRQADLLIMLGLAWILCTKLLSFVLKQNEPKPRPPFYLYALSFVLATCIFTFFGGWWWIPTPSYNSLTLESLLIIAIALLNIHLNKNSTFNAMLLGLGVWLTFMAKPTSAILISVLATGYILSITSTSLKKISLLFLSWMTYLGLIFLSAWIIDGSLHDFVLRLKYGAENMSLLYQGHLFDFLPQFGFLPDKLTGLIFIILLTLLFAAVRLSLLKTSWLHISFVYTLLVFSLLILTNNYMVPFIPSPMLNVLILTIPLGIGLTYLTMPRQTWFTSDTRNALTLSFFFVFLPYIFALGTRGDVWTTSLRMGLFWILAAIPLVQLIKQPAFVHWRMLIILIASSQALTIALLQVSMEHPYRQLQSLRSQTKTIDIINTKGKISSQLTVGDDDARYINALKLVALNHGYAYGDAMIDLTGAFPTSLYLLGAKAIGTPWYIAGFGGSTDFTMSILSQTSCHELATAWVLTSLNGVEKYSPKVLEPHGMNPQAFQKLNEIIDTRYNLKHQLLKPIRGYQESVDLCEKKRQQHATSVDALQTIMRKKQPSSQEIINLSQIYMTENKPKSAITLLRHATQINSSNPILYNNLCVAYALEKEYEHAIYACSQAIQLDPNFQLAKNNLAWAMQEKHQRS